MYLVLPAERWSRRSQPQSFTSQHNVFKGLTGRDGGLRLASDTSLILLRAGITGVRHDTAPQSDLTTPLGRS